MSGRCRARPGGRWLAVVAEQIAEHALLTHGDADAVQYVMVDMPEDR